jgi:hypothetical protein
MTAVIVNGDNHVRFLRRACKPRVTTPVFAEAVQNLNDRGRPTRRCPDPQANRVTVSGHHRAVFVSRFARQKISTRSDSRAQWQAERYILYWPNHSIERTEP